MRKLKLFLTCLLMAVLSIGQMWAVDYETVATFESSVVVTANGYNSYSNDDWALSKGGNSSSCGFNKSNKTAIGDAYGTDATPTHHGYTIVSQDALSNVCKITFVYTGVASANKGTPRLYLGYSTDNGDTWSAITLATGEGLSAQGVQTAANTTYTFQFTAISSARYAIVHSASQQLTGNNDTFRFDNVTATFYAEKSSGGDPVPELQSIAVSGGPTTTTYENGDAFDVTGLVVTGTYDIVDPAQITEGITWEVRTNSTSDAVALANYTLTQGQTSLQVRATVSEKVSEWYTVNELTVNEHVVNPGKYTITLNNALWGTSYTSTQTSTSANALDLSGSSNDVQVSLTNGSSTYMYITDAQTRAYAGYTLIFAVPTGYNITKIEFTKASKWGLACESGLNADADTWTGEASSVEFTFTARTDMTSVNVTFEEIDYTIVKTLKSIAVSEMTTTFEVGETFSFDGTCTATYTVTQGSTSLPEEDKQVIPTEVSDPDMNTTGEKEVTISFTDGGVTKTAQYNITVNPHTVTPGEYEVLLNNVLWGVDAGQQAATVEDMAGSSHDINFATTKGSSQMYASATQTRFYANATLTISAPTGYNITSIVFAEPSADKKWDGSISADEGTYTADTKTWAGEVNAVVFTFGAQNRIATATVTYALVDPTAPAVSVATSIDDIPAAGVTDQVLDVNYTNVDLEHVAYALFNDAECQSAFTDEWLSVSLNGDKDIVYTLSANTSFTEGRTAYIQLTAPADNGTSPAVVKVIAVEQLTKEYVFASLAELLENITPTTTPVNVTVTLTNEVITGFAYGGNQNQYKNGVKFNVNYGVGQSQEMEIYFHDVPGEWVAGGKISGTLTNCPWKIYSGTWELAPTSGWEWSNLTYNNPPEIASIEIRGNATAKTYIEGQVFNPAGLSVIAIYDNSLEEDVTTYATWSYDPAKLSTSDTQVTATAEYSDKSDSKTINELVVSPIPNKTIDEFIAAGGTRCYLEGTVSNYTNTTKGYFDLTDNSGTIHIYGCTFPSSFAAGNKIKVIAEDYELYQGTTPEAKNVEFVSKVAKVEITIATEKNLYVNDTWTIEVTTDPAEAVDHISYSLNDGSDACIDETELANGVIKAIAEGDATITITIPDGDGYLANTVEMNVHVNPAIVRTGIYAKVTSNAELTDGEYLIVYETGNLAFDGSLQTLDASSNNFAVTIESNKIIATAEIDAKSFTINMTDGTIKSAGGKFIGRTAISNGMNESSEEQYTNTLSIDNGGNAVIVGSAGAYMRYNANSDQERFRYFKSDSYTGQKAIQLYKKATYTRTVSGNYGTICLPNGGILTNGALYEVAYYDNASNKIFFDEVLNGEMKAGMPYIFLPNEGVTELKVVYTDSKNKTQAASADEANGLVGNLGSTVTLSIGDYFLYKNQYYVVSASESRIISVPQYYAYINMSYVPDYPTAPAPGRRRVSMNVNGEQVATGVESIQPSEVSIQKVLINGELFILRGEKMYDATGRLVK